MLTDGRARLKITADFSHWVVVSERLLDQGEEDRAIMERITPHVRAQQQPFDSSI